MQSFSLIIPVYNEEHRIDASFPEAVRYCRNRFREWEILYVDDGSSDKTYEKLLSLQQNSPGIRVLRHDKNAGKGKAVRTGFSEATGELILFSDVDFSTPIEEFDKLLYYIQNGFDIAIASRALPESRIVVHQSSSREALGKAGNFLIRAMLYLPFEDTQCGFKLFRREAVLSILPKLKVDGFAFDVEMLTVAGLMNLRIVEVPVIWKNVEDSKVRPIHSLHVLRDIFRIRYEAAMGKYS